MGMKGKKSFQQSHAIAAVCKPTTINNTTADVLKVSLAAPAGRKVSFLFTGDVPATSVITVKLLGKKISDGLYEVITDKAAAEIAVAAGKLQDGNAIETTGLMATVDLEDIKGVSKYSEIALRPGNGAATAFIFAGIALWADLHSEPSGQEDQFDGVIWAV